MGKRTVSFYIDGKIQYSLETDVEIARALRSFLANMRFRGIYLEGRFVKAVAATGESVETKVTAKRMRMKA